MYFESATSVVSSYLVGVDQLRLVLERGDRKNFGTLLFIF